MAKLEKILPVPEKSLIFDPDDDTFFNSENACSVRVCVCFSVNGHRYDSDLYERPARQAEKPIIFIKEDVTHVRSEPRIPWNRTHWLVQR